MKNLLFCLLVLFTGSIYGANIKETCARMDVPVEFSYCVLEVEGSRNTDILYFYHGLQGSTNSLKNNMAGVMKRWEERGKDAPIMVSLSFGPFWLLTTNNGTDNGGLVELVTQRLMPFIENNVLLKKSSGRRLLVGASMGGFNASKLALHAGEKFDRVALLCPALADLSPFSSADEIQAYIQRTGANPKLVGMLVELAKNFFPTQDIWDLENPFNLAADHLNCQSAPLMISIGDKDEWGFHEGAFKYSQLTSSLGVDTQYVEVSGGHCAFDTEKVADFLLP